MLVLDRKLSQSVMIGGEIQVTVLEVHGKRVKLGFIGPQEVPILREEVFRRGNGPSSAPVPKGN